MRGVCELGHRWRTLSISQKLIVLAKFLKPQNFKNTSNLHISIFQTQFAMTDPVCTGFNAAWWCGAAVIVAEILWGYFLKILRPVCFHRTQQITPALIFFSFILSKFICFDLVLNFTF